MSQIVRTASAEASPPVPIGIDVAAPLTFIVPQDTKPVFHSTALTGGT